MTTIDTDYLIVGAGTAGMAFADELVARSDAEIVLVDRQHRAGGHWNAGYPFLRLHQPSAFYGVNSRTLGTDSIDTTGPNAGYYERATASEICDYYQKVLDEQLLSSGQVRFFGMCDYVGDWSGDHVFTSRLTGRSTTARVRRRIVDATYLESSVPSTHSPAFRVAPDARLVPPGELVDLADAPPRYTVLGAGKTAMDACCWLLDHGVDPDGIRWVRPRDAWTLDRASVQPLDLLVDTVENLSWAVEALAQADTVDDFFRRVEACGHLFRLDPSVTPTMFRGAILSQVERDALTQIEQVVRLGRVIHLGVDRLMLDEATIPTNRHEVYVDCSAYGLRSAPARPIFEPGRITLQSAGMTSQPSALAAFVEATRDDDADKNRLCPPAPTPNTAIDAMTRIADLLRAFTMRLAEPDIAAWQEQSRLSITRGMSDHMGDPRMQSAMARWVENMEQGLTNATRLLDAAAPAASRT